MTSNLDLNDEWAANAGPGGWNDPGIFKQKNNHPS
jgi:hypothetical protein